MLYPNQVVRQRPKGKPTRQNPVKPLYELVQRWWTIGRRATLRNVTFVGVTGSCGKTTTVIFIDAILSSLGKTVCCTNESVRYRIEDAIRSTGRSTKFCVGEVGTKGPGDIARQAAYLKPQIGVVTTIGADHYRQFRSLEATATEKGRLVEGLPPDGVAILNADDPHVRAMAARTGARVLTFGLSPEADVRATEVSSAWPERLSLTVTHGADQVRFETRLVGEHWATSVLAALACGIACGMRLKACAEAIGAVQPPFGRYSVHGNGQGATYVLDSLKSPYWTIASGLQFVLNARAPRRTIVFGTISDYPGKASARYRRVARQALEVADRVIFVGAQSGHVDKLRQGDARDRLVSVQTAHQASALLAERVVPGELIYVKASRNADHLERIMLSQLDRVVCWREGCRRIWPVSTAVGTARRRPRPSGWLTPRMPHERAQAALHPRARVLARAGVLRRRVGLCL